MTFSFKLYYLFTKVRDKNVNLFIVIIMGGRSWPPIECAKCSKKMKNYIDWHFEKTENMKVLYTRLTKLKISLRFAHKP